MAESVFPELIDGLPNICGQEERVGEAMANGRLVGAADGVDLRELRSCFAVALHMHQPLIPAGGEDISTAAVIGNLQWMTEHQDIGDNHNAPMMRWCYKRMGEFLPQLLDEGLRPRVMLDYSGTLLYGLRQMGAHDVLDALVRITRAPRESRTVEWLGSTWGHAVAPSTPVQDFRLHVQAWQHHFASIFGLDALSRVRGFSPAEMALPNHPDVAYEFVRTLRDCGYRWVLVQEHTVETPDGTPPANPHVPHRLVCTNSRGETADIIAIVKTQGSDTKLVGQMQPYYEALGLGPVELAGTRVPPLVVQIADGENGGVMMNEFPPKYVDVVRECSDSTTPMVNVSEYLAGIAELGVTDRDLPQLRPLWHHLIWQRLSPGDGPLRLASVITDLAAEQPRFHTEGGSWTNDVSWVQGYEDVLAPMDRASAAFHQWRTDTDVATSDPRYRRALFHLLSAETSCYRYWGQGRWTEYGAEMARRAMQAIQGRDE
ncbi:glycosyl hydrolase family 57 [Kutzneria sp. 744]|uniref:glycosyl hydrolase family 57 n=1 Tax=Kutzneria sp. (strain 744) TaxID=345341 RepID=UPI0003EECC7F|nr:glycosyl hydrolase family 57 [Kutzneria sp. 744]EWM19147.1 hypothetical protein KUTG_09451 [Kutzneria sp. 744]